MNSEPGQEARLRIWISDRTSSPAPRNTFTSTTATTVVSHWLESTLSLSLLCEHCTQRTTALSLFLPSTKFASRPPLPWQFHSTPCRPSARHDIRKARRSDRSSMCVCIGVLEAQQNIGSRPLSGNIVSGWVAWFSNGASRVYGNLFTVDVSRASPKATGPGLAPTFLILSYSIT